MADCRVKQGNLTRNYAWIKALILLSSCGLTKVEDASTLLRFVDFLVKMWLWNACLRLIFPVPVSLKRFFAPEFVFCFGIVLNRFKMYEKVNRMQISQIFITYPISHFLFSFYSICNPTTFIIHKKKTYFRFISLVINHLAFLWELWLLSLSFSLLSF